MTVGELRQKLEHLPDATPIMCLWFLPEDVQQEWKEYCEHRQDEDDNTPIEPLALSDVARVLKYIDNGINHNSYDLMRSYFEDNL